VREVIARAPVRIDFGGGWTDVPPYTMERGGCVCNLAIALYARATLRECAGGAEIATDADDALASAALRRASLGGVRLIQESDFPLGAGLGGSSAAGVAAAAAIAAWRRECVEPSMLAERSRALEVEELGIAGGFQDHYAAAYGGALALHFAERTTAQRIPLSEAFVKAIERQCIVAYTGESRISGETITAVIDAYRAGAPRVEAALDRMRALAESMIDALARERLDELGALVREHWEHQRSLHEKISTPAIERLLDTAQESGAIGGKALGASGGGCVVVIAPSERADEVRARMSALASVLPFRVDQLGAQVTEGESSEMETWRN
jgi:D-glycero-alpha-D-manno-heptose-7-phosphate kinase